jgi:hypothetical protein
MEENIDKQKQDEQTYGCDILENTKKNINIVGVGNRYQIKKLTNKDDMNKIKLRKESQKWKLPEEVYERKFQLELLCKVNNAETIEDTSEENTTAKNEEIYKLIKQQLERKLTNYKQQDINKKIYDSTNIINFDETLQKLIESNLLCYYCNKEILVLYEIVRENYQWTLDRIDNSLGHNKNNVLISCLQCNLKRRKRGKDAFLFTKQLQIVKKS